MIFAIKNELCESQITYEAFEEYLSLLDIERITVENNGHYVTISENNHYVIVTFYETAEKYCKIYYFCPLKLTPHIRLHLNKINKILKNKDTSLTDIKVKYNKIYTPFEIHSIEMLFTEIIFKRMRIWLISDKHQLITIYAREILIDLVHGIVDIGELQLLYYLCKLNDIAFLLDSYDKSIKMNFYKNYEEYFNTITIGFVRNSMILYCEYNICQ